MMDCLRIALGDDRIIGKKFPRDSRLEQASIKQESESENDYNARMYTIKKQIDAHEQQSELTQDMNPNGFWECMYSVEGIVWHLGMTIKPTDICKVVNQGLAKSDPKFVDKVIYMVRHPRCVAKSQEKIRRMWFMDAQEERDLKIHTPEMFVHTTTEVAKWFKANPEVPVKLVYFDDLITNPDKVLNEVSEFLGEGDFRNHQIEPKLNRSKAQDVDHPLWGISETIYDLLCKQDWNGIIQEYRNAHKIIVKEAAKFICHRTGKVMVYKQCEHCKANPITRYNFKLTAESKDIEWWTEPCMFECLHDVDNPHISIEESIQNNFWMDYQD